MKEESKIKLKKRAKFTAWTIVIVAIVSLGSWYYMQTQNEILVQANEIRKLKGGLKGEMKSTLQMQDSIMLELLTEPFSWAIRTELLSGNTSTIHQYLAQYVKHASIELITVVDKEGKIISSTDKKMEGKLFASVFSEHLIDVDRFRIVSKSDRQYVYQPIMGFDRKMGMLFLVYFSDKEAVLSPHFEIPQSKFDR